MTKKITTQRQWRRRRQRQRQDMQCKYILPTPHTGKTACFSENKQRGMETKYSFAQFVGNLWNIRCLDQDILCMIQQELQLWIFVKLLQFGQTSFKYAGPLHVGALAPHIHHVSFCFKFLTFLNNWRLQGHDKGINKICVQMSERYKWLKMSHNLWI